MVPSSLLHYCSIKYIWNFVSFMLRKENITCVCILNNKIHVLCQGECLSLFLVSIFSNIHSLIMFFSVYLSNSLRTLERHATTTSYHARVQNKEYQYSFNNQFQHLWLSRAWATLLPNLTSLDFYCMESR